MAATATKLAGSMAAKPRSTTKNPDDPRGQFGAFLRAWIDRHHGGDEGRLAKALGKSERTIRTWMLGSNSPKFGELDDVAHALGFGNWVEMILAVRRHSRG